ncbi:PREDICTED: putative SWI/SNF-related matrix-associated actin-dependent regulator of chromatin subfamily A member 3-like 1 [Ipomoea nil]|uniref:putative SWI/SNF-related matrix-associated actin-dependent regulator of chromatin subfamily A member 3-like 1 n=1 Tax=Ipomoea nil TaxID=35883 RepID=UPI0009019A07|nr:PREDICTED: putative SWI/SNF-related matrix-associated actin-dependent regulator of chromatin subfamily A member 3-like 1 [Ipomoea nil]
MSDEQDPVELFMVLDRWPLIPFNGDGEDDVVAEGSQLDGSSFSSSPSSSSQVGGELLLMGFVIVNIVGLQYYSGTINGRELVSLVRDPLNTHDPNAIKVLNTRSAQVGYIERAAAQVFAPLIDSRLVTVEGIVPKVSRQGNRYKIPCQVHIFARIAAFESVKSALSNGGLNLISEDSAAFALSEAAVVKDQVVAGDSKSIDAIFKLLDEKVLKKEALGTMEPPNSVIKSELLSHQKEGLWWLVQQESAHELPPFWEEKDGVFFNALTNYSTDKRPDPIRGGIFADDMGLGKTLTLLSLISFDKCASVVPVEEGDDSDERELRDGILAAFVGKNSKRGRVSTKANNSRKKLKSVGARAKEMKGEPVCDRVSGSSSTRTTLVVCPPAIFSVWITQLEEHTRPGSLKVYLYYGRQRTTDANVLQKHDIVLTTYNILANEEQLLESPIKKIEWWRVILDEAHIIKNVNAQQTRAVNNLIAKRRWVVTGTPIQNHSMDLYSLMTFLRVEPLSLKPYWVSLIQRPLVLGDENGIMRLQILMATMSLRRTKEKTLVGLPSKTLETIYVELSGEEREIYEQMELRAKSIVMEYICTEGSMKSYLTVLSALVRLRQICTDIAMCPPDLRDVLPVNKIGDVNSNPKLLDKMLMALQDDDGFDCPICISPPKNTVITSCAHIFCKICILKTLQHMKSCCPMCRHPLTESDLFFAPSEPTPDSVTDGNRSSSAPSSKATALLKLLCAVRDQNPTTKSVVFSQFRTMLLLLEAPLKAAGFKTLRLDGKMSAGQRADVIKGFGVPAPEGPTILLASLKASGAGINLTMASRVYLFEPWWNPAVEEQAMDRVHRIGQTEEVKIVRMIAHNTIEERILQLQEKKKLFASKIFKKKNSRDQRDVSVDDLRTLMHL